MKVYEDGKEKLTINLAVQRSFKNDEGIYEVDYLRVILWNALATHTAEYCDKGDLVGIKGRIQTRSYESEDNELKYVTEIIADKISFLSSASKNKNDTQTFNDKELDNELEEGEEQEEEE
jgi:single-strand DNA-binding protein